MPRNAYKKGMFDEASPAEQLVNAGAPADMALSETVDLDSEGNAIRPWEPKGEEGLGAPPAETVEEGTLTAGGNPPFRGLPPGRFEKE